MTGCCGKQQLDVKHVQSMDFFSSRSSTRLCKKFHFLFFVPEVGEWAGLSKANLQMVEVSLTEHTVLEEAQLPEEHLRHLSQ